MNCTSFRAKALACALLATTALAAPARAQFVAPPNLPQQDANGVDLRRGTFTQSWEDVSVGTGSFPQRLALVRTYDSDLSLIGAFGDNATHNFHIRAYRNTTASPVTVDIVMGAATEQFTQVSPGVYATTEASGSTLSGTFAGSSETLTYTMMDGSVITFSPTDSQICDSRGATCGLATKWTFPSGAQITFSYSPVLYTSGTFPNLIITSVQALWSVTNNFGYKLTFLNQKNSRLTTPVVLHVTASNLAQSPATVASIGYTYDSVDPKLATVTDTQSNVTTFGYSGYELTSITPPSASAPSKTIAYATGPVSSITLTGIGAWTYSIGATQTTVTDPGGNVTTSYYNSDALPQWTKDGLNRQTSYTWDGNGRLLTETYPEGNSIQLTYDARGNVTQTTAHAKPGSGLADISTSTVYPSTCTNIVICNKPTSATDARGHTTDYTYDSTTGLLLTVTLPAPTTGAVRPQTRYGYTSLQAWYDSGSGIAASGLPVSMLTSVSQCQTGSSCSGTSDEAKATISYGATGVGNNLAPVSVSSGSGDGVLTATTAATYDAAGNLLTVDGPLAGTADTSRYRWDSERRLIGITSPDPDGAGSMKMRAARATYDVQGRVTALDVGTVNSQSDTDWTGMAVLQTQTTAYDSGSRKSQDSLSAGGTTYAVTQYGYDTSGRPQCVAQRMNPAIYASLPSDACSLGTSGSYGSDRIVKTTYDAANEATKVTSAYGTAAQADDVTTTYTNNGLVSTVKDAEANLTTYGYDGVDRKVLIEYPSTTKGAGTSNASDYEQMTYDANANLTAHRLRDGNTINYTYDALNRTTYKDLPGTEPDVTYAYDNLGRMTGASQTGNSLSFTYDALGRKLTETGPQGTVTSTYDLAGRRTKIAWPDSFYVNYDYLVTGEVSAIRENGATSGVGVLASYAYDDLGQRTSVTRGNGTSTSYGYDTISRLTSLSHDLAGTTYDQTLAFGFSPAGQIIQNTRSNDNYAWLGHGSGSTNSTTNGLNQLTAVGSTAPIYDSKGNMTYGGGTTYTYSSENLLTSSSGGASLSYDPALRLYQVSGGVAGTQRFAYDGTNLLAEYNSSNALLRRYVFGPGTDEPIVWYEGSGTTDRRFLHADERGTIMAVTNSSGTVLNINTYDEYGKAATADTGRFLYTGQAYLPEAGLYYYKARMYASGLGLFMQTDPIGYGNGLNWYGYVHADPLNLTDPFGTCAPNEYSEKVATKPWSPSDETHNGGDGPVVAQYKCVPYPTLATQPSGSGTSGAPGGTGGTPSRLPCAYPDLEGRCALVRGNDGKLHPTPDAQRRICANYHALQDGAQKTSDGFSALGITGQALGGSVGNIMGAFSAFGGFIANVTTGNGFRPFGYVIFDKSAPPPGC